VREFGFEMALCARLEAGGRLVSRQLGASTRGRRVVDAVIVEPGPAFDERARLMSATIPAAAIDADVGPGRARFWKDCFDRGSIPPERAREVVERGVEIGFFERERRGGRTYLRQAARYPEEWFGRLIGVENKPDLDRPGDLRTQLRRDVSLAALDAVILATESYVTGAHRNRIPPEVGIWRVDADVEGGTVDREVVREPTPLPVEEPGLEIDERRPARTDVEPVTAAEKARLRRTIAEHAYGKGWRVAFPDCPHVVETAVAGVGGIPYCSRAGRIAGRVDPCSCTGDERGGDSHRSASIDLRGRRATHSPWVRDPEGAASKQAGLERFL
jgi:hypothetical protein